MSPARVPMARSCSILKRFAITAIGSQLTLISGGSTGSAWSTVASCRSRTGGMNNGPSRFSTRKRDKHLAAFENVAAALAKTQQERTAEVLAH